MEISGTIQSALERYQAGSLREAANICIEILDIQPNNLDVLLLLGEICTQLGNYDAAMECFNEAVNVDPASGDAYFSLGNIFLNRGRLDESIACYERALRLNPGYAEAYNNLGNAFEQKGFPDEAIRCYKKALQLHPKLIDAYNNLGIVFQKKGNSDEAINCYRMMIEHNPDYAEAHSNLGTAFQEKGMFDKAIACYYRAIQLNPDHANAYYNLGNALKVQGKLYAALDSYRHSLRSNPASVKAFNNLGNLLKDMGRLNEAEDCYRRALQIDPRCSFCYSNLLFLLNYNFRYDAKTVFSEHLKFAEQYEGPLLSAVIPYTNDRTVHRRLRIGYVSPDFKGHSVAYFIEPVLIAHDREQIEVFCYSDVPVPDRVTGRIRGHADHWRSIAGMPDERVAELIRDDRIDILVDLAGHASNVRLLLFARKPAPVQVSWIGYPATTGLSGMGYKIVDHYTDPPGMTEQFYTEELLRMPENFLCYLPDRDSPGVGKLPALSAEHITFGSFNNFAKVSSEVVSLWSEILKTVPDSRLIIKAKSMSDTSVRANMLEMFAQNGVAAARIDLLCWEPSTEGHLNTYGRIDIGLDTFPYNGTTTTCEALWMGVPVITLAGESHASRVGASLLSNIGLPDLIAGTQGRYADIAVGLAADLQRLQFLREGLRAAMQQSPLCNAKRFTANLEGHFRGIWQRWCEYS